MELFYCILDKLFLLFYCWRLQTSLGFYWI